MKKVTVYTDGSCSGNPGPGGWGAVLMYGKHILELSGGELYSDSRYLVDGLGKGWAASWKKRGWRRKDGSPALNPELWDRLLELTNTHKVTLHWVKGHAENEWNNRCDELAVAETKKFS